MNLLTLFNLVNKKQEPTLPLKLFEHYSVTRYTLDAVIDNIIPILQEGRLVGYPLMEQWKNGIRMSQGPIFLDGEVVADFIFDRDTYHKDVQRSVVRFVNTAAYKKIGRYLFGFTEANIFLKFRPTLSKADLEIEVGNGFRRRSNADVEDNNIRCWYKDKWVRGSVKGCGEDDILLYVDGEWIEEGRFGVDICWNIAKKPRLGSREGL